MRLLLLTALALVSLAACSDDETPTATTVAHHATSTTAAGSTTVTDAHDHDHGSTTTAFPTASATGTMNIQMREYVYVDVPATVNGPRVVINAVNRGKEDHEVQVTDEDGTSLGVIEPVAAGKAGSMALQLEPGTYTMECLIDVDNKTHADLGMRSTFVVET